MKIVELGADSNKAVVDFGFKHTWNRKRAYLISSLISVPLRERRI